MLLALLLLPAAEIAAFIAVAAAVGLLKTVALFLATSLIGLAVLRGDGIMRIAAAGLGRNGRISAIDVHAANLVVLVGGILLVVPGFISDAVGIVLLLMPRVVSRALLRRVFGSRPNAAARSGVVDLDDEEWQRVPDRSIADHRDRDPG